MPWEAMAGKSARTVGAGRTGYSWTTTYLDGDGLLDLVVTQDGADVTVGDDHWDAFLGASSGFDGVATAWNLPVIPGSGWGDDVLWSAMSGEAARTDGGQSRAYFWNTLDLSGEGVLDLVVTFGDSDVTLGDDHWDAYLGTCW